MKISLLLLRQYPIRLIICILATVFLGFMISLNDRITSESAATAVFFTFVIAYVNNFFWQNELRRLPFPLTDKQVAWLPLGVWAALLAVWTLVFALATCLNVHHAEATPAQMMHIAIVTAFFLLVLSRAFMRSFVLIPAFLQIPLQKSSAEFITPLAHQYWPLALLGIVYLVWDAPHVVSINARCDEGGEQSFTKNQQDFTLPLRPTLRVALGNSLCVALVMLYVLGWIGLLDGPDAIAEAYHRFVHFKNFPYVAAGIAIALAAAGMGLWIRIRASGYSVLASVPRWLACSTGFGFSLRYFMGILSGKVSTCARCRKPVMVWMEQCPHCEGEVAKSEKTPWYQWVIATDNLDPLGMFYRVMVPVFLIVAIAIR